MIAIEMNDILAGNSLFFGKLYKKDKNDDIEVFETLGLKKNVDGKEAIKGILIDNKNYPLVGTEEEEHFECLYNFNDLLSSSHLDCFIKNNYTVEELEAAIYAYNRTFEMNAQEFLSVAKVSKIAADWWTKSILDPEEKEFDSSIHGMMANGVYTSIKANGLVPTDEQLEKFNLCLQNRIRMQLLAFGHCVITNDYNSVGILKTACEESEIKTPLSLNSQMTVYIDEVVVDTPNGKEVLYEPISAYQKVKTDNK